MELVRLIYVSDLEADTLDSNAIADILKKALTNNPNLELTGMLLCNYQQFLQVLEGPQGNVKKLFEKIEKDPRHSNVKVLQSDTISRRMFAKWSMGFSQLSDLDSEIYSDFNLLNGEEALDLLFREAEKKYVNKHIE